MNSVTPPSPAELPALGPLVTRPRRRQLTIDTAALALMVLAAVALSYYTYTGLERIRIGLPSQLFDQQRDIETLEAALTNIRDALQGARLTWSTGPGLARSLRAAKAALADMRRDYTFDSVEGASAAHALVHPVVHDIGRWTREGVSGYGPESAIVVALAHRRAVEAVSALHELRVNTGVRAERLLAEEAASIGTLKWGLVAAIGGLAALGLGVAVSSMRQRNADARAALAGGRLSDAIENLEVGLALFAADDRLAVCNRQFSSVAKGLALPVASLDFAGLAAAVERHRHALDDQDADAPASTLMAPRRRFGPLLVALPDGRYVQADGHPTNEGGTALVVTDVTESRETQIRLQHLATHDALTGLPSRRQFESRFAHALAAAERHGTRLTLMFVDVDRFKQVNDTYGHSAGDRVLTVVAERLRRTLRDQDVVARLSGDEFAVVLENAHGWEESAATADRIMTAMRVPVTVDDWSVAQSVSIGVAHYPDDASNAADLMHCADVACYRAKDSGRGNAQFYTQAMNDAARRRSAVAGRFAAALEGGALDVAYVPQYAIADGSLHGIRVKPLWRDAALGVIETDEILAVAERLGLSEALAGYQLSAMAGAVPYDREGAVPPVVWFDLPSHPPRALEVADLLIAAQGMGALHGVTVGVMIRDAALGSDASGLRPTIDRLVGTGIRVGVTEFGGQDARLAVFTGLSIDTIELAASLVGESVDDSLVAPIRAVVAGARARQIDVVAGPIQSGQALARLQAHGVDVFFGPMTSASPAQSELFGTHPHGLA